MNMRSLSARRLDSDPPHCASRAGEAHAGASGLSNVRPQGAFAIAGASLVADLSGALYWPEERLLAVADLHLEKGSAYALRGVLLPPYDTATTLERLAWVIAFYDARVVVALGDNFHDPDGAARLGDEDRAALAALQRGRDWIWIAGNHDPEPAAGIGGEFVRSLGCGRLAFRHEPDAGAGAGEIAGHLHPCARVRQRGRTLTRRCFASDARRAILPAFGAYAGGLNIRSAAFGKAFPAWAFTAHLIGDHGVYALPASRCLEG